MANKYSIRKLEELLSGHLGSNKKIVSTNIEKFHLFGQGSIMLKIDLKLNNQNDEEETIHTVAKILPESEDIRKLFNVQVTFKNEIAFYKTVLPALRDFQKQHGIDDGLKMFAKYYGGRINLDGSDEVKDDAILVLENLVESGFANATRQGGFDLEAAKIILKDAATFQATAIALKLQQPKTFEERVKVHCNPFNFQLKELKLLVEPIKYLIRENPDCAHLADVATTFFDKKSPVAREPYATIVHCDLWVNNTMQKIENGKVVKNVIVDFQLCDYRSCASDVFFFLWTSVPKHVLEEHLDDLIAYYHSNLVATLQSLDCDTSGFTLDNFYEELKTEAGYEFGHASMFAFLVKNNILAQLSIEERSHGVDAEKLVKRIPDYFKEFFWFMVLECQKRGWLY